MRLDEIIRLEQGQHERESEIYSRLRVLASGLHIPIIEMIACIKIQDKQTGEIKSSRKFHIQSYTRNIYAWTTGLPVLFSDGATYADGSLALKDTGATIQDVDELIYTGNLENGSEGYDAPVSLSTWGALAGRGVTAFSIDDFEIELLITHGTGPNQMEYGASVLTEGWNSGSSYYWSIHTRTLDNNSAASITVWEIGLVCNDATGQKYLISRDLIGGGQVVTTADRLIIDYETRVNF